MCEPTTLIMAATAIAGGAMQYSAQRQQGYADQAIASQNARIGEIQADQARQSGSIEEARQRLQVRQMLGRQRAGFGSQGIEATGTAADILGDTAGQGEADISMIRANALRQAWGYDVGAQNDRTAGTMAGKQARLAGYGTILGTTSQLAGQYSNYQSGRQRGVTTASGGRKRYGSGYGGG